MSFSVLNDDPNRKCAVHFSYQYSTTLLLRASARATAAATAAAATAAAATAEKYLSALGQSPEGFALMKTDP